MMEMKSEFKIIHQSKRLTKTHFEWFFCVGQNISHSKSKLPLDQRVGNSQTYVTVHKAHSTIILYTLHTKLYYIKPNYNYLY